MDKKFLKIIGIICSSIFCFVLYFLYYRFPNFLTSIFSPVDNSIFQYTKILFGSIILSGVTQKIIIIIKKDKINNICLSNFIGAISSIPIFIIIFLLFNKIADKKYIIIIVTFITIIISQIISYMIMNKKDLKMENKTIFLVIVVYIIFTLLTYYPLKNILLFH